jgi:hypothetical protein
MKLLKKASGNHALKMSKEEWKSLGKEAGWMDKVAMPVPISEEQRHQMADEGVFVSTDEFDKLPNTPKGKLKSVLDRFRENNANEFFVNLDPKKAIMLPAIYKADPSNLVDIDGHNYYIISVTEPRVAGKKQTVDGIEYLKGDPIPGEIIAMDVENGLPVPFVYEQVIDRIKVPSENKEKVMAEVNEEIEAWNKRVETIEKAAGPTKLALQIAWAEDKIKDRIEVLRAQETAIRQRQEMNFDEAHPGYNDWMQSLRDGIAEGRFNLRDAFDSLLFLHQSNPQALLEGLQNGTIAVPEELREGLIAIAAQELQLGGEKELKRLQREREREERIEEELPAEKEPVEEPLRPYTLEDIPDAKYQQLQRYKTLGHWKAQMDRELASIGRSREELERVLASMEGLRGYIGALEKGQRAKDYLSSPEGQIIIDNIKQFLNDAQLFMKRYKVDIIADNTINPALLGKGSVGNALLAVSLNRIYSIIKRTMDDIMAPVEEEPVEATEKTKIEKMSELLWKPFEDRMRLK